MNIRKLFGLLAVAGVVAIASPVQRAEALSLINPASAGAAKYASENLITEVRGGRGGGGGFRGGGGGGFRGGFGGGGFRGGGFRSGGFRGGFYRPGFRGGFYGGPSYYYGYGAPLIYPRRCRLIRTYYGLRRVCRPRTIYYY